jgi:prepilin-type N-terminal cleavage/methylation domain-containing protein
MIVSPNLSGATRQFPSGRTRAVAPSQRAALRTSWAFTLLELLMVIAIMGIIAAIALPSIRSFKPNAKVAGTRQLLDAVNHARQLAIGQRTTVYMVFVPTNFFTDKAYEVNWTPDDKMAATNVFAKQLIGYAYVSLRSVGDQPGAHYPRYLSSWKTLPQGAYIPPEKFWPNTGLTIPGTDLGTLSIPPFSTTNNIPFPLETTLPFSPPPALPQYVTLPYIAFDGMGQLVSGLAGQPELIPVAEGSVSFVRDPDTKAPQSQPAQANEMPPGNTVANYSLVYIDRLTGRAHVERRKVQ